MDDKWWKLSDGWWIMKTEWSFFLNQTRPKSLIFSHGAPAIRKPEKTKCKTLDVVKNVNNWAVHSKKIIVNNWNEAPFMFPHHPMYFFIFIGTIYVGVCVFARAGMSCWWVSVFLIGRAHRRMKMCRIIRILTNFKFVQTVINNAKVNACP